MAIIKISIQTLKIYGDSICSPPLLLFVVKYLNDLTFFRKSVNIPKTVMFQNWRLFH